MKQANPSLLSRISLAFGTFFSILADGQLRRPRTGLACRRAARRTLGAGAGTQAGAVPLVEARPTAPCNSSACCSARRASSISSRKMSPPMPTPTSAPRRASCMKAAARSCTTTSRSARSATKPRAAGSRCRQGFDAAAIRVTGNVVGNPPFHGSITHRGWRVVETRLPKLTGSHDLRIVAPAEVEL
jgi:hypothetical protein